MSLHAAGEYIILQKIEQEEKRISGLIIPETAQKKQLSYKIISIGADCPNWNPESIIYIAQHAGQRLKIEDQEYTVVNYKDIVAGVLE